MHYPGKDNFSITKSTRPNPIKLHLFLTEDEGDLHLILTLYNTSILSEVLLKIKDLLRIKLVSVK